ncbi:hypothetical protein FRC07_006158, partial [Ceratobasidium sp. 392]
MSSTVNAPEHRAQELLIAGDRVAGQSRGRCVSASESGAGRANQRDFATLSSNVSRLIGLPSSTSPSLSASLESTPKPEHKPYPKLTIVAPAAPASLVEPPSVDTIKLSAPPLAVKAEDHDALMDSDAKGEDAANKSEPEEEDTM